MKLFLITYYSQKQKMYFSALFEGEKASDWLIENYSHENHVAIIRDEELDIESYHKLLERFLKYETFSYK